MGATLERLTEAFNDGDYEAVVKLADPDVEMVRSWEKSSLRGPSALREWMKPDAFEDQESTLLELTPADDKVLVHHRFRARGAASGIDMDVESWGVWTFDEVGLVTRVEFYLQYEEAAAREAAGLA